MAIDDAVVEVHAVAQSSEVGRTTAVVGDQSLSDRQAARPSDDQRPYDHLVTMEVVDVEPPAVGWLPSDHRLA